MDVQERSLRVLVIAPTPFFADRGCHVRILEEARNLMARGHRVTICTYHHGRNVEGIETKRTFWVPWYLKLSAGPSIHKFYVDLLLLARVIWAGWKYRPDIIHAHLHEGVIIGKIASLFLRVPMVADLQGSLSGELVQHRFFKPNGILHRIFLWVERILLRLPDTIIVSSREELPGLLDLTKGARRKVSVIRDGVDTKCFSQDVSEADEIRAELGIPSTKKVVGYLGVLTDYQGIPILLQAIPQVLKNVKSVQFLIMGYPNVEHYKQQAEAIGIGAQVKFLGRIPYENAPKYLSVCDLAVSPKLNTTEANGKLFNYMAMGLPVVASDIQVNRDVLGDDGVFVEAGNPTKLAEAISKVLIDEEWGLSLGKRLQDRVVKEYSWTACGDRLIEEYKGLVNDHLISKSQKVAERSS